MIYFVYSSSDTDALRALGVGAAGRFEFIPFGGIVFGIIHSSDYRARAVLDSIDKNLVALPGPSNGKLSKKHLKAILKALPNAKEGDAMSTVLSAIYAGTSHEGFNPDHH